MAKIHPPSLPLQNLVRDATHLAKVLARFLGPPNLEAENPEERALWEAHEQLKRSLAEARIFILRQGGFRRPE